MPEMKNEREEKHMMDYGEMEYPMSAEAQTMASRAAPMPAHHPGPGYPGPNRPPPRPQPTEYNIRLSRRYPNAVIRVHYDD